MYYIYLNLALSLLVFVIALRYAKSFRHFIDGLNAIEQIGVLAALGYFPLTILITFGFV